VEARDWNPDRGRSQREPELGPGLPAPVDGVSSGLLAQTLAAVGFVSATVLSSRPAGGDNVRYLTNRRPRERQDPRQADVFISYCKSKEDIGYHSLLDRQLVIVRNAGYKVFSKHLIKPGAQWRTETSNALISAQVAVLLVSDNYLSEKAIVEGELPRLLLGAKDKGKRVMPVIVDYCGFDYMDELAEFQSFNDSSLPVSELPPRRRKKFFLEVAIEVLTELQRHLS
jgi:hypothetical protein